MFRKYGSLQEAAFTQNRRLWVRLQEKGGKTHAMPFVVKNPRAMRWQPCADLLRDGSLADELAKLGDVAAVGDFQPGAEGIPEGGGRAWSRF
jgi:hypothetical protein